MECEEEMSYREKDLHQTVFPDGLRERAKEEIDRARSLSRDC
jgi:hypothetical protein